MESASEARYLRDMLHRMIAAKIFLDSSELTDLRSLVTEGVNQCDCLVVLCTEQVLTRPWCLIEIFEASKSGTPMVFVSVAGKGFSIKQAREEMASLEETLLRFNPGGVEELDNYFLSRTSVERHGQVGFSALQNMILQALPEDDESLLSLNLHLTDNHVIADVVDLVDEMASKLDIDLAWDRRFTMQTHTRHIGFLRRGSASPKTDQLAEESSLSHMRRAAVQRKFNRARMVLGLAAQKLSDSALSQTSLRGTDRTAVDRPRAVSAVRTRRRLVLKEKEGFFIAHCRADAGRDAETLARLLQDSFKNTVSLNPAGNCVDIRAILEQNVLKRKFLVLMLTKNVLTRPWVLLEVFWAIKEGTAIIPINVVGAGYDFGVGKKLLSDLSNQLQKHDLGALEELHRVLGRH
eukprot:1299217-Prymnesium_polylepis.1